MTSTTKVRASDHRDAAATPPVGAASVQDLLRQRADLPIGHPGRARLRERSIEAGLPLARRLANRYRGRGEPLDDLYQVAALALVRAVDGFDPARPVAFSSYAVPSILGALKRHFRDHTWRLRVPRPIQNLAIRLGPAGGTLTQRLGRSPTLAELAAHLEVAEHDVAIARDAWRAYRPGSLDALSAGSLEQPRPLSDTLGTNDTHLDMVIDWHAVQPLVAALPARQRRILALRYVGDLTQAQIAVRVGISQMHVSRLLERTLTQLRTGMLAEHPSRSTRRAPRTVHGPAN
jgi:RNA polymerase sigma-B factor